MGGVAVGWHRPAPNGPHRRSPHPNPPTAVRQKISLRLLHCQRHTTIRWDQGLTFLLCIICPSHEVFHLGGMIHPFA